MLRALLLCPGRGSYTARELGWLARPAPDAARAAIGLAITRVDSLRSACGDPTIRDIDAADRFHPQFLEGHNAAAVTFACTAFDFLRLDREQLDIVAVAGNSMGWYSALYVGGALQLDDAFDLVETMGGMTREGPVGGQVVYPLVDSEWRADPDRQAAVQAAIERCRRDGRQAGWSIRFGGFAVLWGDEAACRTLHDALPQVELGSRTYPMRLRGHSAFHSPLMRFASERAHAELAALAWAPPAVPLIDGRGHQWRPLGTEPDRLRDYTLDTQVTETFDFRATVRVALREYAPDVLVLLGPGDSLGAAVAQLVIAERWQGIDSRRAFEERQQDEPLLLSLGRPEQAERLLDVV